MQNKQFSFEEFLIDKGFKKVNSQRFELELSEEYIILVKIENDRHEIPLSLDTFIVGKNPINLVEAEKFLKNLSDVLDIEI